MNFPTKAFEISGHGRVQLCQAASIVKQASLTVGSTEVELTAGLAHRRLLYVKPLATDADQERFIRVGPSGFSTDDVLKGTIVWERYEIAIPITPDVRLYAVKDDLSGDVAVRILEVGEN